MRYTHTFVYPVACALLDDLRAACQQIDLAGSLRRGEASVKDIEIVAVPKPPRPQFGRPVTGNQVEDWIAQQQANNAIRLLKDGPRYKQFWVRLDFEHLIKVDLFLVLPPAQWGPIFLTRTGPADFSKAVQVRLRQLNYRQRDGAIYPAYGETPLHTPDEADVFRLLGIDVLPPYMRSERILWKMVANAKRRAALEEGVTA